MKQLKFVDKFKDQRTKLIEGRCTGDGFAFCKKTGPGQFEAIQPISTCKDYLNDVVWSETTGGSGSFYGLKTSPTGCFGQRYAYIAISILPHSTNPDYKHPHHAKLVEGLLALCSDGRNGLVAQAEAMLKMKSKTKFFHAGDGVVIAFVPRFWTKYMYLISLWSLLVRLDISYKGSPALLDYLKSYSGDDTYTVKGALAKIKKVLDGELPKQPMPKQEQATTSSVHNNGIYSFNP